MKKSVLILLLFSIGFNAFSQKINYTFNQDSKKIFTVENNKSVSFECTGQIQNLNIFKVQTKGGQFFALHSDGLEITGNVGSPALPEISRLIEIPWEANPTVEVISYDEQIIDLNSVGVVFPLLPKQPSLGKSEDPNQVPFHYNQNAYSNDNFVPQELAFVEHIGYMRGVRMGRIIIKPVQYNPVTNELRILTNIKTKVVFKNANLARTQMEKGSKYSPVFDNHFSSLANYKTDMAKDTITEYPIKYLIISDRMFETQLQPFVAWKTKKGFNVTIAYTDVIGTTTTAIKNYITGHYTAATTINPAPTYVLFVGDVAQIPTYSGTTGTHPTDLYYFEMTGGGDHVPDIYYGRFSAQNVNQLLPQIEKTMQYEQYTMPDPSYLQYVVLVAGVDASNAPTFGNGQINYGTSNYFNAAHNITSHTYLYGSGSPITSDNAAASAAIIQNVSNGVGFGNYTAHCSPSGWADPTFEVSNIPSLQNENKYGVLIGNCCLSNKFDESECFGEGLLRAAKKGAVGYMGASNSTYWDEDYFYGVGVGAISANPTYASTTLGAYDKIFHENGEAYEQWAVSSGQINFAGNIAVESSSSSRKLYYWELYHVMGDPSLMPYMGIPSALTANYLTTIPLGVPDVVINTEEHAYIAISYNGVLHDAEYTFANTSATMDLSWVSAPCTLDVVITKQNKQPHIGQIVIVPNNAPYIVYQNHALHDASGNNNQLADYGETILMDLTLKNVGNLNTTNVSATLSSPNTNITITDNSETFGDINAGVSVTQNEGYAFSINSIITDQESVPFTLVSTNGSETWNTTFNVVLNAPALSVPTFDIDDATTGNNNGRLDPGEAVEFTFNTLNNGHAISPNGTATLSCSSPHITIVNNSTTLNSIGIGAQSPSTYSIQIDAGTPLGTNVSFIFNVNQNGYTATKTVTVSVGLIVEDWESNTFTQFPWSTSNFGNLPWTIISSGNIYEGGFASRSGAITHNQSTTMSMTVNVLTADTLSFYKKVSCEPVSGWGSYYDYLEFFVDATSKGKWAGEVDWSHEKFYVTTGNHTFKWTYKKDDSVDEGDDASYVDFIIFPSMDASSVINNNLIQTAFNAYPNPFNNSIQFNISSFEKTNAEITIYNTLGQVVGSINAGDISQKSNNTFTWDANHLPKGIYFAKLKTKQSSLVLQIIKD